MQKNKKFVTIIVAIILLSLLFSVGINAEEFPDGATVYFYDVHGTDKEIITELVDNDSGTLLKTMDMFGPAGEYFTQGIRMWGYDAVGSDFPWHMMVSAEMTSMSGSTSYDGGRSYYTQIGAKFTKLLSPDTYNATVYYDPHTCVANVKHITVDQDGNESLYSSSTLNLTYDSYFSTSKRYINNHTLNAEYAATVSGTFEWSMLNSIPNLPEDSYTSRYHSPTWEDIEESYHDEREIDIIFKYTLNHYSIEYDANGGENAPDSQTKWYGIDLALSEDIPTRDGYTFLGWHTSATATYALYEVGETYTANSAKRFYAVWKENEPEVVPEAYTVTYDANGGSGAPSAQSKTEGVDLTLSYLEPSRSGYSFLGWSKYSWSPVIYFEPGATYSEDSDLTLYAVWEEEAVVPTPQTYNVSYDANGGSGVPLSQIKTEGIDLILSYIEPTYSGYTFLGWSKYSWSSTVHYKPGDTYTNDADLTLYAVWEAEAAPPTLETYTVSYDANGGSGAPSSQIKTEGIDLTLSYREPTYSGYNFLGWTKYSWSSTIYYEPGDTYSNDSDITLYAVWEEVPAEPTLETYTVSYDANGGVYAPESQLKTEDVDLTLSYQKPIYSGYIFLGWTKYSWSSIIYYEPGDSYTDNSDITLYAVWEEDVVLETYTISYDANGGSGAPSSQTKYEDEVLTLSSERPSRNGYEFLGWSTSSVATTPTYYPGGSFSLNANTTLYAVWEYSPITYDVYYNANGGSGTPSAQIKTHDIDLTLSTLAPTREGYTFKGWDAESNATSASYWPGDSYTENSSITLYAVWEKDNYEFSVSDLTLSAFEINKNESLDIEVRTDSWDKNNAYSAIPVQLYIDGSLMSTEYVDFGAYGIAYITFNIDVGEESGEHEVEVRVNWNNRSQESDPSNNSVSGSYTIREDSYELGIDFVTPNADYLAGTTVITSFTISNDSEADVIPAMEFMANFSAYYYNGSSKMVINNQDWTNIVIPKGGTNLIYFKWTVPETLVGKTVYCECVINSDSKLNENNRDNNTITLTKTVGEKPVSQTPNTRYEGNKPSNYSKVSAPTEVTGSASWTVWEYTNGAFVQRKYGVRVSADNPQISPSVNCETAEYINGEWTMKSGYGVQLAYTPTITTLAGCLTPSSDAYTDVQAVCAMFPENKYLTASSQCRTLIYTDSAWRFEENDYADNSERVHFIPIWFDDGEYIISVTVTEVWTPAGMITAVRNAKVINVAGTIYDDWYQG